ncbi:MAG: hypothetical protein WC397_04115 [Candidatus Paceibacterota bacterium]|jgi:F0F1-type ATP synthase membrane subunit b/b'
MNGDNQKNKKRTDKVLEKYNMELAELEKEREKIVSDFVGFLRDKKLKEIKKTLE